jgi:hypothetical protein
MIGSVLGAGMQIGGSFMAANAASRRKRQLEAIANLPGLKMGDVYGDVSGSQGQAEGIESRRNEFNRAELRKMLGETIPGYEEGQAQRSQTALSLMRGEVPADVQEMIQRSAAARAVSGGYGGTPAGRNLVARDLGRTSLDMMNMGQQQFAGILGTTPRAEMANYMLTPSQLMSLRSQERTQKMGAMKDAAMAQGATEVGAKALSDIGGAMMGAGGGFESIFKDLGIGG